MGNPSKLRSNPLTALIITYNEIGYIERCIESVSFADEIVVVDSNSTDGTYEFLESHPNVRVILHPFENFTAQKSFALQQASHEWVLFVDADEVVTPELRDEIIQTIDRPDAKEAYWFYRQFMFGDQRLRFSGWQTDKNHRLFRKSKVQYTDRKLVHETLEVDGASGILKEKLIHYCYKDYESYQGKMLLYGRLKARESFYRERKFNYLMLWFKPFWRFFVNYVIRLGFLDGRKGWVVCYLNALSVRERYLELKRLEKKNELTYYLVMP